MANNASRLIMLKLKASQPPSPSRWLCTSTAEAAKSVMAKNKGDTLFSKLTALRGSEEAKVQETLEEWAAKEVKPIKRFDIIGIVYHFRKYKKYNHAIKLYEWMEKSKTRMKNADHAIRMDLLAKVEGVASAEKYFDSLQGDAKTNRTYGALFNCYCKEKVLDKALELFEKMKDLGFTSTLNYNNMIALYLDVSQPEKVPLLAEEMEGKNIAADQYTYNQLVQSYALQNDFDAVEAVLLKMERNKVQRDWFTYGNQATVYVNAGLIEKANAALEEMKKIENLHDREAFHTLITLYARTSNPSGVNQAWDSLKSVFPKPSNVSYLIMLLALSKLGDVITLEKLFADWESDCLNYDVRVANVIIESYLNRDMVEKATLIYENIMKRGSEPNLRTLESFASFYIEKHRIDLALIFLEMGASKANPDRHKWFPTEKTVAMFLKYFEEKNDMENAERFCKSMKKIGRLDDTVLCTNIAALN
ncbi:hypothetical protein RJ639_034275, partial [Escallonia herrerae]